MLIASGSTHNFINKKVASRLWLPVIPTKPFSVKVANGHPMRCQGRFNDIPIEVQGIPFSLTFVSLPLTGLNVDLEVK